MGRERRGGREDGIREETGGGPRNVDETAQEADRRSTHRPRSDSSLLIRFKAIAIRILYYIYLFGGVGRRW